MKPEQRPRLADGVIRAGAIHAMTPPYKVHRSIATRDGWIVAIAPDAHDLDDLFDETTQVIDERRADAVAAPRQSIRMGSTEGARTSNCSGAAHVVRHRLVWARPGAALCLRLVRRRSATARHRLFRTNRVRSFDVRSNT